MSQDQSEEAWRRQQLENIIRCSCVFPPSKFSVQCSQERQNPKWGNKARDHNIRCSDSEPHLAGYYIPISLARALHLQPLVAFIRGAKFRGYVSWNFVFLGSFGGVFWLMGYLLSACIGSCHVICEV